MGTDKRLDELMAMGFGWQAARDALDVREENFSFDKAHIFLSQVGPRPFFFLLTLATCD
jgi:hypothetical protein